MQLKFFYNYIASHVHVVYRLKYKRSLIIVVSVASYTTLNRPALGANLIVKIAKIFLRIEFPQKTK